MPNRSCDEHASVRLRPFGSLLLALVFHLLHYVFKVLRYNSMKNKRSHSGVPRQAENANKRRHRIQVEKPTPLQLEAFVRHSAEECGISRTNWLTKVGRTARR